MLSLGITLWPRNAGGGGAAFNPLSLSPTVWLDPSDTSTLWQDTGATSPVTADGQSVARIDDKSGNARHFTQPTAAARPLYKTSGGLHWLQFDGVDDFLSSTPLSGMITVSAYDLVVGGRLGNSGTGLGYINQALVADSGQFFSVAVSHTTNGVGAYNWDTNEDTVYSALSLNTDFIFAQRHESGTLYGQVNSSAAVSVASGNTNAAAMAGQIYIGKSVNAASGRVYGLIACNSVLTLANRDAARVWMAAKSGVTL